jgi:hypothetical protein
MPRTLTVYIGQLMLNTTEHPKNCQGKGDKKSSEGKATK